MIRNGTTPIVLDNRDLSFHGSFRRFGAVGVPSFAAQYSADIGKTMNDQNSDGFPNGCTGYTQSDNLGDEYDSIFKPSYTYEKTCLMEGHDTTQSCDMRTSLKSTQVYGVQRIDETTDQEAEQHRGGKYFNVYDDGGLDWFDSIRSAVAGSQKGVSCGTPWFYSWEYIQSGILPMPTVLELSNLPPIWHNYACKGWKTINGKPYLMIKSWQGPNYGDRGWCYMSREVANVVFAIRGAAVFTQPKFTPDQLYTVKLGIIETALMYIWRMVGIMRLN